MPYHFYSVVATSVSISNFECNFSNYDSCLDRFMKLGNQFQCFRLFYFVCTSTLYCMIFVAKIYINFTINAYMLFYFILIFIFIYTVESLTGQSVIIELYWSKKNIMRSQISNLKILKALSVLRLIFPIVLAMFIIHKSVILGSI